MLSQNPNLNDPFFFLQSRKQAALFKSWFSLCVGKLSSRNLLALATTHSHVDGVSSTRLNIEGILLLIIIDLSGGYTNDYNKISVAHKLVLIESCSSVVDEWYSWTMSSFSFSKHIERQKVSSCKHQKLMIHCQKLQLGSESLRRNL